MYCSVTFSFHNHRKPMKRRFVYAAEHIAVKRGDLVEVDFQGTLYTAVVNNVFEQDLYNTWNFKRKSIVRKIHTNTAKAAVRKRFNQYKTIHVNTRKKKGRKLERKLLHQFGENYHRQIIKYVCLGNILAETSDSIIFLYKNHTVYLKKTSDGNYVINALQTLFNYNNPWYTPDKFKDYVNQLYDEHAKTTIQ